MTTFVTSFVKIGDVSEKSTTFVLAKFLEIVKTGIQLCVYADESIRHELMDIADTYLNVIIMKEINIHNAYAYKVCNEIKDLKLPYTDNPRKDTKEYMMLMNSKIEFVHDAITLNPWNTNYFAWIDFSISHVFKTDAYRKKLIELSSIKTTTKFLAIPGCYTIKDTSKVCHNELQESYKRICWRFCGGFFMGDKESLTNMYDLYISFFPTFIHRYKTIVWEVNFWAWLEQNSDWDINWYKADHNDSIINIPYDLTSTKLFNVTNKIKYSYPIIDNGVFVPSSISYIKFKGMHILNTRYINYSIKNNQFIHHNSQNIIITKNVMSILNDELLPTSYDEVSNPPLSDTKSSIFYGIEDIRLFIHSGDLFFMGTSMSHSSNGNNSIVFGNYNVQKHTMDLCRTIETDKHCEKNWTPISDGNNILVIYKWFPMEVSVITKNVKLKLTQKVAYDVGNDIFKKFRGSTTFTRVGDNLIGVVHFCEGEFLERKYFHVLVLLDGDTLKPLLYSNHFIFGNVSGIEFCTGFAILDMKYTFWVSVKDGNPLKLTTAIDTIPLTNKVYFNS